MINETERQALIDEIDRFLTALQTTLAANLRPCPACAEPMPDDYDYCDQCGASLRGAT